MSSLPTPSSSRLAIVVTLGVTLAVLLAAELVLRTVLPGGGGPYELGLGEYRSLVREIADEGVAEVAILGSSRAREGVLSRELGAALRESSGQRWSVANYALAGAHATEVDLIAERMLRSPAPPKIVLYGVGPRQLLAKPRPHVNASLLWDASSWWRARGRHGREVDSFLGPALRNSLSEWLWIVRYRRSIHQALFDSKRSLAEALRRAVDPDRGQRYNPMRGQRPRWQQRSPHRSRKISRAAAAAYLTKVTGTGNDYALDSDQVERLTDTVETLRRAEVEVVLFAVPISPVLRNVLPQDVLPSFERRMKELAETCDVRFVSSASLAVEFRRKDFREQSHLNLRGAKKLTSALARHALVSPPPSPESE